MTITTTIVSLQYILKVQLSTEMVPASKKCLVALLTNPIKSILNNNYNNTEHLISRKITENTNSIQFHHVIIILLVHSRKICVQLQQCSMCDDCVCYWRLQLTHWQHLEKCVDSGVSRGREGKVESKQYAMQNVDCTHFTGSINIKVRVF